MKIELFLERVVLACALAMSSPACRLDAAPVPGARPPNILFIVTDDHGPWAMGNAGDPNALTPNLDRLREGGARLTNCYSPTPVCSPARASILTSRYGTEVGILGPILPTSKAELTARWPTWPRLLSDAGYVTGLVGKYHLGLKPESHPNKIGYAEFSGFRGGAGTSLNPHVEIDGQVREIKGWTSDILTDLASDFIRRKKGQPWALSLHFWAPHANDSGRSPKTPDNDRSWLPLSDEDRQPFEKLTLQLPEPDFPNLDIPKTNRMLREYLGSIHSVDRNVGRLVALLNELGLAQNTVVIFTSDHGFNMGHHGIWHKGNGRWLVKDQKGSRRNMWETSLGVPALVRWPEKIPAGSSVGAVISHLDWFPTIAAIAGVPLPAGIKLHGRNVLPVLEGKPANWPNEFYAQQNLTGARMRSYRTEQWKLVRFHHPELTDEFYDRRADPAEGRNLIASSDPAIQAAIHDLDARLRQRMSAIQDNVSASP